MSDRRLRQPRISRSAVSAAALLMCACTTPRSVLDTHEAFDSTSTYSRTYAALDAQTCEAARRTLLSQGYVISSASHEQVRGRKSFQPEPESHVEVEINVVCAREGYAGKRTIAFVNAVQDRFALKKSASSASVGVGVLGSLSLPFTGSDDSLVKVASATITSAPFYDRFFQIVERYLAGDPGQRLDPATDGGADDAEPPPIGAAGAASAVGARPAVSTERTVPVAPALSATLATPPAVAASAPASPAAAAASSAGSASPAAAMANVASLPASAASAPRAAP